MTLGSKQAKKDFYAAKHTLEQLQSELPKYETWLADADAEEGKLRKGKAELQKLADAKTRTSAARELLEQHRSDIEATQAEADRLEADYRRETTLDTMVELAKEAEKQRDALNTVMLEANQVLTPLVERLEGTWRDLNKARRDFLSTGVPLAEGFGRNSPPWGATGEQLKAAETEMNALLDELKARGAKLDAALTPHDGRRASMADLNHWQDPPRPEPYGSLLWKALFLREEARFMEAQRALRAKDALRAEEAERARTKAEPQPERPHALEVVVDMSDEASIKQAAEALGSLAQAAYRESRPGHASDLAVWTLPQGDPSTMAINRLKNRLPAGAMTVR
jgi:myosin heavy subunit